MKRKREIGAFSAKRLTSLGSAVLPYRRQLTHDLEIGGLIRRVPLLQVSRDTWIAYYDSLGDTEVVDRGARNLAAKLGSCDLLVTTESKGIPLAHAIATYLGLKPYVVCRKKTRPFMVSAVIVRYRPITAGVRQTLLLDARDALRLRGKKVGLVDDIVTTGETLRAMAELVRRAGGTVVAQAALLVEGDERSDVYHVGVLPIFKRA